MKFSIQWQRSAKEVIAFSGAFDDGARIALLGESGAGKTTLLRYLAGLNQQGKVAIEVDGKLNPKPWQSACVLSHQQPVLFPHHRVAQTLAFAAQHGRAEFNLPLEEWQQHLGLSELLHKNCKQLSGGQAQRVALLRALLAQPKWLLLDEPMAALDFNRTVAACEVIAEYLQLTGAGLILASHNDYPQRFLCDQALRVHNLTSQKVEPLLTALNNNHQAVCQSTLAVEAKEIKHGLLAVDCAGQTLYLPAPTHWQVGHARINIPADEVSIAIGDAHQTSMVNRLSAVLVSRKPLANSDGWQLTLDVHGQSLLVNISTWSYQRLQLALNQTLFAEFKLGAVYWCGQLAQR